MFTTIQNAFSAGELSPSIFGRTDLQKYHAGASTARNFFINYRGGASSRAGFAYIGMCKQGAPNAGGTATSNPPRDITFQFNLNQGYSLEFGDQYMRIKSNGAYVIEAAQTVTAITNANPGVVTIAGHGYSNGDWLYAANIGGMTEFNGLVWIVQNVTTNTFTLTDLFGTAVNTTAYPSFTSGGTFARIYTVVSPYAAIDLPYLKFTQSADTMSLTCVNQATSTAYPPYDLKRLGATNWTFTQVTFASDISAPTGVAATATSSTTVNTWYSYVVTAVSVDGEESIASSAVPIENNDISINAGSNTITWNPVSNAVSYNVYQATPCYNAQVPAGVLYGYVGTSISTSFVDTNITADFTRVPPTHQNPFAVSAISQVTPLTGGSGYTQSTVSASITTSTGSGAVIQPIVNSGAVVAYVVQNGGQNYAPGDTITVNGSGATYAAGSYDFINGNPTASQTIILNGVTWTFVTSGATGPQTNIKSTLAATLLQLAVDLTASANGSINVASYAISGNYLNITYNSTGTGGNAYTLAKGTYNGTISGSTLTGGAAAGGASATASLVLGPSTGVYPSVVAYFQQRRAYANTLNNPDTYYMSQPGAFLNMDSATPSSDTDAIIGAPWAQQINGIQFMVPMTSGQGAGLVVLTGLGAWLLTGGSSAAISPSSQVAFAQAYNGCNSTVSPIIVNYDILYVQSKGSIVRDLTFNFFQNVYTGTDTTVLSNHLFQNYQIVRWAYAEEPYKLIWAVRNDGTMLSFTYLKEQDVYGWARHDTNGLFQCVTTVTEPPVDAVYAIVQRYVRGNWVYYSERMDNRSWENVEQTWCVDSGLSLSMSYPNATLTVASANGTSNISSVNIVSGGSNYTAPVVVVATDTTGVGSGATFSTTLSGGAIVGITPTAQGSGYVPGATSIVISDVTGSGAIAYPVITNYVTFTTSSAVFNSAMVGSVIRVGGGKATIVQYVSSTQVVANITQPITSTVPNDPNGMPIPFPQTGTEYSGWSIAAPVTSVSGLNHLEGLTVAILADGSVLPQQTVTNGTVTLPNPASQVLVGLPYTCQLQTMYLDPAGQRDTPQGKRKNIFGVTVRMEASRGMSVGTNQTDASTQQNNANIPWSGLYAFKERNASVVAGASVPLFTGDEYIMVGADWETVGQIAVQQTNPLPANCLAVVAWYQEGDTSG